MDYIRQTKRKNSRASNSAWIPQQIIIEILSRLPVKTLLRFRCVCKSWNSLISDAYFVRRHLVHTSAMGCPSRYHLLSPSRKTTCLEAVSLDSLVGLADYESIAEPPRSILQLDETLLQDFQPVGSCNGLILLLERDSSTLFLWNPSIRQSKILPDAGLHVPRRMNHVFNFGYHSLSNDYIVVEVSEERQASLYSLRENSWRRIADSPYDLRGCSACCGGSFIWEIHMFRAVSRKIFLSFDLAKESFQEHSLPQYGKRWPYMLTELYGDVCAIYDLKSHSDVWVMKGFGAKESWVKIFTFSAPAITLRRPLCTWGDESVLAGTHGVAICNKKTGANRVIRLEDSWTFHARIYVESLVSPNGK